MDEKLEVRMPDPMELAKWVVDPDLKMALMRRIVVAIPSESELLNASYGEKEIVANFKDGTRIYIKLHEPKGETSND